MQSSFSLIKKDYALEGTEKKISTEYVKKKKIIPKDTIEKPSEVNGDLIVEQYQRIADGILEDARRKRDKMLLEAADNAKVIEREAYEKGYEEGKRNGLEDGKKEAYEVIIPDAKERASNIINNAEAIMNSATDQYNKYLDERKEDILNLSIKIAEQILKTEIVVSEGIVSMVENAMKDIKGESSVIIKANIDDIESIKKNIEKWKITQNIKDGIFVLEDTISRGNVIIEKESGTVELGIDIGMQKIKEAILG